MNILKIGDKIPEFFSLDQKGNPFQLSDLAGKKTIVFFYPRANTPGCSNEACNLRDNYQELKDKGYQLVGVSADNIKKQMSFSKKFGLPFTLLADEEKVVINAFGVWGPKKFQGREYDGIHRTTFLVNEKCEIDNVIFKVKTKDHAAQILDEL